MVSCSKPEGHRENAQRRSVMILVLVIQHDSSLVIVYDKENHTLLLDMSQKFHIRLSPFKPAWSR